MVDFADEIAADPRYRKEMLHWFEAIELNVLLWENLTDYRPGVDHFEQHIQPPLT